MTRSFSSDQTDDFENQQNLEQQTTSSFVSNIQASARGVRISNACQQCKRRKTKCTGRPSPCEACEKASYACQFDEKPESKSKLKTTSSSEDDIIQSLLNGLLNAMKHNDAHVLGELFRSLRTDGSPQEVAAHLRQNLSVLQDRGIISNLSVDDDDLIALAQRVISGSAENMATDTDRHSQEMSLTEKQPEITEKDVLTGEGPAGSVRLQNPSSILGRTSSQQTPNLQAPQDAGIPAHGGLPSTSHYPAVRPPDTLASMSGQTGQRLEQLHWDSYPMTHLYPDMRYSQSLSYHQSQISNLHMMPSADPSFTTSPWLQLAGSTIYGQSPNPHPSYPTQAANGQIPQAENIPSRNSGSSSAYPTQFQQPSAPNHDQHPPSSQQPQWPQ